MRPTYVISDLESKYSLPPWSNIWRQGWSLPEWRFVCDYTLMVGSLPCPQIRLEKKKMEVTNALASYEMAKITAVNSLIV
jgi:hypothetical protein